MAFTFGNQHEFADMAWYPGHSKVIYRIDDRVPSNASGNGLFDFTGFRSTATLAIEVNRLAGNRTWIRFACNVNLRALINAVCDSF